MGMARGWRTELEIVVPKRVLIDSGGKLPVRIVGVARGLVRSRDDVRFVWGEFDETFWVATNGELGITFVALGLGGRAQTTLSLRPQHRLRRPRASATGPLQCFSVPRSPALQAVALEVHMPRVNSRTPRVIIEGLP